MIEAIKRFFDSSMSAEDPSDPATDEEIRLAACALLLELAHADDEFSDEEGRHLAAAIRRQYGVNETQAEELIRLAEEERRKAVDLYQFTRLIREHYTLGQKMVLVEIMWGLVYSDGELSTDEDLLMRKVCNLLKLEPGYLADVRKRVMDKADEGSHHTEEGRPD